jgi:hypothetical protein
MSADCYGEKLMMTVTPKIFLIGDLNINEAVYLATSYEVKELNRKTIKCARVFYFGVN